MTIQFESHAAGAFMYLWGFYDGRSGCSLPPGLLLNAQNDLDSLIGDLFGIVDISNTDNRRWFIAELKRDEAGFDKEIYGSKRKPARVALYEYLRVNPFHMDLASFGHFGVWVKGDELAFSPYPHAVGRAYEKRLHTKPQTDAVPHGREFEGISMHFRWSDIRPSFAEFHTCMHNPAYRKHTLYKHLYAEGLGLPTESMRTYLECMMQCNMSSDTPSETVRKEVDNLIIGCVSNSKSLLLKSNYSGLHHACERFRAITQVHASGAAKIQILPRSK